MSTLSQPLSQPRGRAYPARSSRAILTGVPTLRLVATPSAARGIIPTVIASIATIVAALIGSFVLQNHMVQGAYELQKINKQINVTSGEVETLQNDLITQSTPTSLAQKASGLGMAPATSTAYVDLATGQVLDAHQGDK